jgi:hypothetical protein
MERPKSAAAARQEVKTRTHKMLLESGIPALLEKLLADCFMSCPTHLLDCRVRTTRHCISYQERLGNKS